MKKLFVALLLLLVTAPAYAQSASGTITWDFDPAVVTNLQVNVFNVERKTQACAGTGAFAQVATVPATLRTYTDATLQLGNTYCYRVAASNATGKSPYSNSLDKLVPLPIPPAPTNLNVTIQVSWSPTEGQWKVVVLNSDKP